MVPRQEVSAEGAAAAAGIASVPSAVLLHRDVGRGLCTWSRDSGRRVLWFLESVGVTVWCLRAVPTTAAGEVVNRLALRVAAALALQFPLGPLAAPLSPHLASCTLPTDALFRSSVAFSSAVGKSTESASRVARAKISYRGRGGWDSLLSRLSHCCGRCHGNCVVSKLSTHCCSRWTRRTVPN